MSWLQKLLEQHSELESPTNFWLWGGMAAISAVVKDNVWIDRQIYNLYPNIYVMFHAESGLKKGPPISMAKQLVRAVGGGRGGGGGGGGVGGGGGGGGGGEGGGGEKKKISVLDFFVVFT